MSITYLNLNLNDLTYRLILKNIPDIFYTWIKRNCDIVDTNIYELDINYLNYLKMLILQSEILINTSKHINLNNYQEIINQQFIYQIKNSTNFEEEICVREQYERVHFILIEFIADLKVCDLPINDSIYKLRKLIETINNYAFKYKTNILYYEFKV